MASWFRWPSSDEDRGQNQTASMGWEGSCVPVEIQGQGAEPVILSCDERDDDNPEQKQGHRQHHASRTPQQEVDDGPPIICGYPVSAANATMSAESFNRYTCPPTHHLILEPDDICNGNGGSKRNHFSQSTSDRKKSASHVSPIKREIRQMRDMKQEEQEGGQSCCTKGEENSTMCTKRRVVLTLLCIIIAALTLLTVLLVKNSKRQSSDIVSDGSSDNVDAEADDGNITSSGDAGSTVVVDFSERAMMIQRVLVETSVESLADAAAPQSQALKWLADEDMAKVDLDRNTAREIQERFALSALYFATSQTGWMDTLNFLSEGSVCTWNDGQSLGAFCDETGIVSSVNIVANGLAGGPIPSDLNYLVGLKELNLFSNKITGQIPSLHKLNELEKIDLDGNLLSGTTPESLFALPRLKTLFLLNNQMLGGTIPEFQEGSIIESISFFGCSLSGTIPVTISSLSNLRFFQMKDNNLSGTIPPGLFTNLAGLETVGLSGNRLVGQVPPFVNTSNLRTLSLGENQLERLPSSGFFALPNLEALYLHSNSLQSTIPQDLIDLPSLRQLWIHDNQLTGSIDVSSVSTSIEDLFFGKNAGLKGDLTSFLQTAPPSTQRIDLSGTQFSGSISSDITRFSSLRYFNVSFSGVTGTLPATIGRIETLDTFSVAGNNLSGDIPVEMVSLRQLVDLDVSRNSNLFGDLSFLCDVLSVDGSMPDGISLVSDCGRGGGIFKGNVQCMCCTMCCDEGKCAPNILTL